MIESHKSSQRPKPAQEGAANPHGVAGEEKLILYRDPPAGESFLRERIPAIKDQATRPLDGQHSNQRHLEVWGTALCAS